MFQGAIFDLDGTLVDSHLDFDLIRREMDLPPGVSVLEAISAMEEPRASQCREILLRHESEGARRATPMPGVEDFLCELDRRNIRQAIFTRNTRPLAVEMASRLERSFDCLLAREDGPVKPDPWAVHEICRQWDISPDRVFVIGDFRFDLEAGHRAGAKTVLFTRCRDPESLDQLHHDHADMVLKSFTQAEALLAWIDRFGDGWRGQ